MTTSLNDLDAPMPAAQGAEVFVDQLFRTITAVDGFTAQMRRAFGMNAHERLAIAALWAEGPMTMTELGSWIPLSRAAVTTLVDRLEANGYVKRSSDPGDRRRTVVSAQQVALDGMIPVMQPWAEDMHAFASSFTTEEWQAVDRFLSGMRERSTLHARRLKQLSDDEIRGQVPRSE